MLGAMSADASSVQLPGLAGYQFTALPVEQRDIPMELMPEGRGRFGVLGSFTLTDSAAPVKLVVVLDSIPGPLRLGLPEVNPGSFEMGAVGQSTLWLTIHQRPEAKVGFLLTTYMRVKVGQVLLLSEQSSSQPWPPIEPGREAWIMQPVEFRQMVPASHPDGWSVKLTIEFGLTSGMVTQALEFLIACDCPFDQMKLLEAEDSPPGAGFLAQPGDQPNRFVVLVCPSSLVGYRHVVLRLIAPQRFRVESVQRLTRP